MGLSVKRARFCREYLVDKDAREAALRAGFAKHNISQTVSQLMKDKEVKKEIAKLKDEKSYESNVSPEFVISQLKEVVVRSMQKSRLKKSISANKTKQPLNAGDKELLAKDKKDQGNTPDEDIIYEFDAASALKALELLGKHLRMFSDKPLPKHDIDGFRILIDGIEPRRKNVKKVRENAKWEKMGQGDV